MAIQSISELILEMRTRVGDTNTADPFLTDAQWAKILQTSSRRLKKYVKIDDEIEVAGDGSQEYAIPTSARNCNWSEIYVRSGIDHTTDRKLRGYDTHENKIYTPSIISSTEKVVFWIRRPYILGTDELSEDALELLGKLCELEFITHAIARSSDFVGWASLNRSDASINQLLIAKQELKRDLREYAEEMGEGTDVSDFSRY
jgi:hypothetical protein